MVSCNFAESNHTLMRHYMKKVLITLVMAVSCAFAMAAHDAVINGVLVDSQDTTELFGATVKLLMAN